MENGKKFALGATALFVLAVGGQLLYLHHRNNDTGPEVRKEYAKARLSEDDMVFPRHEHPDTMKDERALIGKTLWVSAGGQMDFYPYAAHHADYARRVGTLLGAQALVVKDVIEQVPPKGRAVARIPAGQKHVLLAFTMPQSADPNKEYATPIGNFDAGGYTFYTDEIFFYDDPHGLYKHWGAETWAHIDKHEAVPGMSLKQVLMAYGQVFTPGDKADPLSANQTAEFNNDDHPVRVTFENDKAVKVTPEQP